MSIREERVLTVFTTPKELREAADALEKKCEDKTELWGKSTVAFTWEDTQELVKIQVAADQDSLNGLIPNKPWT